jgi:hypothetical protein
VQVQRYVVALVTLWTSPKHVCTSTLYPPRLLTTFLHVIDPSWISSTTAAAKATTTHTIYRACARTAGDDEFLLIRFQVVCLLTGLFAIVLVRKQKAAAASLFDQRRLKSRSEHNLSPPAASTSSNGGAVEMTSNVAIRKEESKALMSSSSDTEGLDVV